jgi:hypothetical protein
MCAFLVLFLSYFKPRRLKQGCIGRGENKSFGEDQDETHTLDWVQKKFACLSVFVAQEKVAFDVLDHIT